MCWCFIAIVFGGECFLEACFCLGEKQFDVFRFLSVLAHTCTHTHTHAHTHTRTYKYRSRPRVIVQFSAILSCN